VLPVLLAPLPKRLPPLAVLPAVPKSDEPGELLVVAGVPKLNLGGSDFGGSDMFGRVVSRFATKRRAARYLAEALEGASSAWEQFDGKVSLVVPQLL
jgi:hypothetical protein